MFYSDAAELLKGPPLFSLTTQQPLPPIGELPPIVLEEADIVEGHDDGGKFGEGEYAEGEDKGEANEGDDSATKLVVIGDEGEFKTPTSTSKVDRRAYSSSDGQKKVSHRQRCISAGDSPAESSQYFLSPSTSPSLRPQPKVAIGTVVPALPKASSDPVVLVCSNTEFFENESGATIVVFDAKLGDTPMPRSIVLYDNKTVVIPVDRQQRAIDAGEVLYPAKEMTFPSKEYQEAHELLVLTKRMRLFCRRLFSFCAEYSRGRIFMADDDGKTITSVFICTCDS